MSETKQGKQLFTVARVFFLLIVIPLSLMAILIANGIFKLGVTVKERAVTALDQKSQEEIKVRAMNTADEVANFLTERKKDILIATIIPASEPVFKKFVNENRKNIWVKDKEGIRQASAPLYTEISLIDKNGNERIKVSNGEIVPGVKLVNVGNPANTTYKNEDYFVRAKKLGRGEVYVSPVTGLYVNRMEFEKGKRFSGIIRFATPVFAQEGFVGVISLALDYRHLAGYTDHIIPTQAAPVYEADAASGNYAYMVDNHGYVVSHPSDYHIRGLYPGGEPVPALTQANSAELTKKGEEILNLNFLAFLDPNLPEVAKDAAAGQSGIKIYKFAGHTKFVAYAPIRFFTKDLPEPGGFGWIGMGVDVDKFNELSIKTAQNIDKEAKSWTTTIILILTISVIILFLILGLLARGITRSIEAEIPEGSEGEGHFNDDEDEEDK
ncbi:MAG: cache domain-containing protein [Pseudomonadota bacterium]